MSFFHQGMYLIVPFGFSVLAGKELVNICFFLFVQFWKDQKNDDERKYDPPLLPLLLFHLLIKQGKIPLTFPLFLPLKQLFLFPAQPKKRLIKSKNFLKFKVLPANKCTGNGKFLQHLRVAEINTFPWTIKKKMYRKWVLETQKSLQSNSNDIIHIRLPSFF